MPIGLKYCVSLHNISLFLTSSGKSIVISGAYLLANLTKSVKAILYSPLSSPDRAPCEIPRNFESSCWGIPSSSLFLRMKEAKERFKESFRMKCFCMILYPKRKCLTFGS